MNSRCLRRLIDTRHIKSSPAYAPIHRSITTDYSLKYKQKLCQKAEVSGMTVSQIIEKTRNEETERRKVEAQKLKASAAALQVNKTTGSHLSSSKTAEKAPMKHLNNRKDAPPFKALSSILNLPLILSSPHTADQISGLWTAYHASRSNGTGRGYVCASIPVDMFHKLETTGRQYPSFVIPLPRIQPQETLSSEETVAHEFFYMQWDFYSPPELPLVSDDPFEKPLQNSPNPPSATVLFTPLQEYKLRGAFATPHLVLTAYTDLATTHGLVLLRGEITPSASGTENRYMLGQEDAQLLIMSLQKFYIWNEGRDSEQPSGKSLLRAFHETPKDFKWEDLLNFSKVII